MEHELFYIFAILAIISGIMTIAASNPVHSVLSLILTFVNASALFFLMGIEFLGIIFLIVYVGAVSILFLFVVMMLNIKLVEWSESSTRFVPITIIIGLVFLYQATSLLNSFSNTPKETFEVPLGGTTLINNFHIIEWVESYISLKNIQIIGLSMYTDYSLILMISSLILLVAMIGAIILSLDHHRKIKRQDLYSQISTKSSTQFLS